MPSSTSSSSTALERTPPGPWLRTWCVAAALAAVALGAIEYAWRCRGHRPSTTDDLDLWAVQRARVYGGRDTVVLVGQSRMQLDFATDVFRARFPGRDLVDLAVEGEPPMATLRDLCEDEAFCGLVLCEADPHLFERIERERQWPWVRHYHERCLIGARVERALASWVQATLVVRNPQVKLSRVALDAIQRRPWPSPHYVTTRADRSKAADYRLVHLTSHRANRIARRSAAYRTRAIPAPEQWQAEVAEVVPWLRRLEARGGRVVFVRLPTSGEHWQLDERYYPRARYWDGLAAITGAPTVHFADDPRTAGFDCPDTSHLDGRDAPAFTAALLEVLAERGLLAAGKALDAAAPAGR